MDPGAVCIWGTMKTIWIVNPTSGRGRGRAVAETLRARIAERGLGGEILMSTRAGEAIEHARRAPDGSRVIAVGGDGTAHEVVNGIAGSRKVFGLVPIGSGNDLSRALEIPTTIDGALDVIARGRTARIDLGRFGERRFVNSLGLGFEAQVTIESRSIRRLRGFAIYLAALAKAMRRLRNPEMRIITDDAEFNGRRLLVCVGNGPRVGGGFLLTPDAKPDDGLFDVCLVAAMGHLALLRTLPRSLNGSHVGHPAVTMLRTRRLVIESPDGFPFHADGEVVEERCHRLEIEIEPLALEVLR